MDFEQKLREKIRSIFLDEVSVTGNVDGYNTPFAFASKKDVKKKKNRLKNMTKSGGSLEGHTVLEMNEEITKDDLKILRDIIRKEITDVLRDIWLKRNSWR